MAEDKHALCCRPGQAWEGEPVGMEVKFGGLDAYLTKPKQLTGKAVLMVADVMGWDFKNARLVADSYAAEGYLTVLPDFFRGDRFPGKEKLMEWFGRNPVGGERQLADVEAVLDELREQHGCSAIGVHGFCWGGWFAVNQTAKGKIQAAVVSHGSMLKPENIEAIAKPVLFHCPLHDSQISIEFREQIEKVLAAKPFETEVKVYEGVEHGFTLRPHLKGDASDEVVLTASEDALQSAIAFFNKHVQS